VASVRQAPEDAAVRIATSMRESGAYRRGVRAVFPCMTSSRTGLARRAGGSSRWRTTTWSSLGRGSDWCIGHGHKPVRARRQPGPRVRSGLPDELGLSSATAPVSAFSEPQQPCRGRHPECREFARDTAVCSVRPVRVQGRFRTRTGRMCGSGLPRPPSPRLRRGKGAACVELATVAVSRSAGVAERDALAAKPRQPSLVTRAKAASFV
jgi:hypothetical protein